MGLLDAFGYGNNPFASWLDQNRNSVVGGFGGLVGAANPHDAVAGFTRGLTDPNAGVADQARQQALQQQADEKAKAEAEQAKQNRTVEWLKTVNPEYAQAVEMGAMSPADAFKAAMSGTTDAGETWGLTPQAYSVPDGKGGTAVKIGVLSNKGNFKEVPLPSGGSAVFPVNMLNTGTDFKGVGKYGEVTGTTVPIDTAGKAFDEGMGAGGAKAFQQYQTDAQGAYATLGQLSVMQKAMNDPNFYSGIGAGAVQNFKKLIVALGGDPSSVSSMETFGAAANRVVLDSIGGSLGAQISNSDRSFIQNTAPTLTNSPAGNKQLIDIALKLANRKIEVAQVAADYVAKKGSLDANWPVFLANWAETHPVFAPTAPAAPPAPGGGKVFDMGDGVTIEALP